MTSLDRFSRDQRGGSAVEFSLVVTAFLLIVLGVIEYGWYLWTANALQQTAILTARCMGVLQTSCAPSRTYSATSTTTYAQQLAGAYGISVPASAVALNTSATCGGASNLSQVTISYTYHSSVPLVLPGIASSPLTETACFPNQS
jgi:Flp pilus assembly protein TadG